MRALKRGSHPIAVISLQWFLMLKIVTVLQDFNTAW